MRYLDIAWTLRSQQTGDPIRQSRLHFRRPGADTTLCGVRIPRDSRYEYGDCAQRECERCRRIADREE